MHGLAAIRAYPQHGLPCRRRVVCVLTILDGSTFVISDDIGDVGRWRRGRVRRRHAHALALPAAARRREPAAPDLARGRLLQRDALPPQRAVAADSRRHALGRPRAIRRLERDRAPHPQQREHVGAVVRRRYSSSPPTSPTSSRSRRTTSPLAIPSPRHHYPSTGSARRSMARRSRSRTTRATARRSASPGRPSSLRPAPASASRCPPMRGGS